MADKYFGFSGSAIPEHLKRMYEKIAQRAEDQFYRPPFESNAPRMFETSPDIERAQQMARQTGLAEPYFQEAARGLAGAQGEFPEHYRRYMNPYEEAVIDRIRETGNRNLQENILPQLEAQFTGLGQFGSSRHRDLAERAARNIQNEISANERLARAQGFNQAGEMFNKDRARQLEAAREMAGLGTSRQAANLVDISTLGGLGAEQLGRQNEAQRYKYEDALQRWLHPQQQISQFQANLQGLPQALQTSYQGYSSPSAPQANFWGNLASAGTSLLGARLGASRKAGGYISPAEYR